MLHRYGKAWLFLAALVAMGVSTQASAIAISLGTVSSATTLGFGSSNLSGEFEDAFSFTVGTGKTFGVSAFATTGFVSRYGIAGFSGTLSDVDGVLASGIPGIRNLPPFPAYDLSFAPILLGAGDYELRLRGTASGAFPGITASYAGSVSFVEAVAISEPDSLLLAGLAIAGLGAMRRRATRAAGQEA